MNNNQNIDLRDHLQLRRHLQRLVAEACSYPAGTPERQQRLTEIIRVVTKYGRLWKENTPYYHDALQATWEYFCRNPQRYDPSRACLTTWLDNYLKFRLLDCRKEQTKWERQTRPILQRDRDEVRTISIEDIKPARPDIPPIHEAIYDWAITDSDGKLRNTIFKNRPEINAQVLILLNVLPPINWGNIAAKFQLTEAEAKDLPNICKKLWKTIAAKLQLKTEAEIKYLPQFYSRSCYPLLKEFGKKQGYDIDNDDDIDDDDIDDRHKKRRKNR